MNVNLEQTEEYVSGQLKATYGDAFIRGNNILYILSATKLFNKWKTSYFAPPPNISPKYCLKQLRLWCTNRLAILTDHFDWVKSWHNGRASLISKFHHKYNMFKIHSDDFVNVAIWLKISWFFSGAVHKIWTPLLNASLLPRVRLFRSCASLPSFLLHHLAVLGTIH